MPLSQSALRILTAIVKASLRRAVGDPTLQAVAEELAALGQEDLARRLDELLGHPDRRQALAAALEQADACVQHRLQDTLPDLAPLADAGRGLPLRGLPAVLAGLTDLPADDLDEDLSREPVGRGVEHQVERGMFGPPGGSVTAVGNQVRVAEGIACRDGVVFDQRGGLRESGAREDRCNTGDQKLSEHSSSPLGA